MSPAQVPLKPGSSKLATPAARQAPASLHDLARRSAEGAVKQLPEKAGVARCSQATRPGGTEPGNLGVSGGNPASRRRRLTGWAQTTAAGAVFMRPLAGAARPARRRHLGRPGPGAKQGESQAEGAVDANSLGVILDREALSSGTVSLPEGQRAGHRRQRSCGRLWAARAPSEAVASPAGSQSQRRLKAASTTKSSAQRDIHQGARVNQEAHAMGCRAAPPGKS